jgi:hypothetical protein
MKSIDIRSESAVKLLAEFLDMDTEYIEGRRCTNAEHFAHGQYLMFQFLSHNTNAPAPWEQKCTATSVHHTGIFLFMIRHNTTFQHTSRCHPSRSKAGVGEYYPTHAPVLRFHLPACLHLVAPVILAIRPPSIILRSQHS